MISTNGKITISDTKGAGEKASILFAGDLCPIKGTERLILEGKSGEVIAPLGSSFFDRDLAVVNLEAPLTKSGEPIKKTGPNLRVDPGCVEFLKAAQFDVVSLANNHMGDFGPEPVMETISILDMNGIMHAGAGAGLDDARKPLFLEKNGFRIALLSYAEYEFGMAGGKTPGASPLNPVTAIGDIRKVSGEADITLVIIHGGNEGCPVPNPAMVNAYRAFAEAGASAVISMHTHCPQGIEIHNGVPIVYSLGNFLFDYPYDRNRPEADNFWWKGYMAKIVFAVNSGRMKDCGNSAGAGESKEAGYLKGSANIGGRAVSLEAIPYTFHPDATSIQPLAGSDRDNFLRYLEYISQLIAEEDEKMKLWDAWCLTVGPWWVDYFKKAEYPVNPENTEAFLNTMVLRNGFTCSAHYEVVKNFLRMMCEGRIEGAGRCVDRLKRLQKGIV